ncbi:MAG: PD-(D/E)XK nuclease family protein [Magnetococcales bacterium]|nr:PD-(D/E)XK nuclease family protein [Magnetococcales bacterium]
MPPDPPAPWPSEQTAHGGARLLQSQAQCPFQAFARFRLGAEPLAAFQPGGDGRFRGTLVHAALQRWGERLKNGTPLPAAAAPEAHTLAELCADEAVDALVRLRPDLLPPLYARMERERLKKLLLAWISLENQRPPGFQVAACEEKSSIALAGLRLEVRQDRVDRLPGGGLAILDYKTSSAKPSTNNWEGDRPKEPQLPLYAVTTPQPTAALAFAHLAAAGPKLIGSSRDEEALPGVPCSKEPWHERQEAWKASLESLAQRFLAGDAAVDPLKYACGFCGLDPLCRIDRTPSAEDGEETSADEGESP